MIAENRRFLIGGLWRGMPLGGVALFLAVFGADGWLGRTVGIAGLVCFGGAALVVFSRVLRPSPQLVADQDGIVVKTWRGHRSITWSQIQSILEVRWTDRARRAGRIRRTPGRTLPPCIEIRWGSRLMSGTSIRPPRDVDLHQTCVRLGEMWKAADVLDD